MKNLTLMEEILKVQKALEQANYNSLQVYNSLGAFLPQILSELEKTEKYMKNCMDLLGNFSLANKYSLRKFFTTLNKTIEDFILFFNSSKHRLEEEFNDITKRVENMGSLESVIDSMKKNSLDMEVMSINTLTIATRAGKAGETFSYITNEIKRLTQTMIEQSELLYNKSIDAKLSLENSKREIFLYSEREEENIKKFSDNLINKIEDFTSYIVEIINIYNEFLKLIQSLKAKIINSFTYLQVQDRFMQSLSHLNVMYSSFELLNFKNVNSLQQLKLLSIFNSVSKQIIKDIDDKLHENCEKFNDFSQVLSEKIELFDSKKNEKSLLYSLEKAYNIFNQALDLMIKDISNVEQNSLNFSSIYSEHIKLLKSLGLIFSNISSISNRFKSINIAAKIEFIKIKELASMEANIDKISIIIENIEDALKKGTAFLDTLTFSLERTLKEHNNKLYLESNYYKKFKSDFRDARENLNLIKNLLVNDMIRFKIISPELNKAIEKVNSEINSLLNLKSTFKNLSKLIDNLEYNLKNEIKAEILDANFASLEIEDISFLKRLANRFTIFAHKQYLLNYIKGEEKKETNTLDEGSVILF